MKYIKKLKDPLSFLEIKKSDWLPGAVFFTVLFLFSTIMNFSLSYMGNKSEKVLSFFIKNYFFTIILQTLKLYFAYLVIGILLSILFSKSLKEAQQRYAFIKQKVSFYLVSLTILSLFLFVILLFSEKLIQNPQPYVENFSSHNFIFKNYQYFLTDSIHPDILKITRYLFLVISLIFFLASFNLKKYLIQFRKVSYKISALSLRSKIISITSCLLFLIILISYIFILHFRSHNRSSKPNILILSADALRPDHMSCNGYSKNTTPNIDNIVKNSLQVRRTFTALPRTFPSWISMLTSKYPLSHGIQHMFPRTRERSVKLESAVSFLKKHGYRTAVISDFAGDIFPRIDLGFDTISAPDMNTIILIKQILLEKQTFLLPFISNRIGLNLFPEMRDMAKLTFPEILTEDTIEEIKSCRNDPFFIITFYSITHFPFSPPYPYYKKYTNDEYSGKYKYFKDRILNLSRNTDLSEDLSSEDKDQIIALYDGCLSVFDREVGKIIDFLLNKDMLKNTIVLITSDHGENLYDCDFGMGHGEHLRGNYSLEIPFIIHYPAINIFKGKTAEITSSSIDIMPTIFEMAGFEKPDSFTGVSIFEKLNLKRSTGYNSYNTVDAYSETGMWFDNDKLSPYFFHHQRIDYPDISGVSEVDFTYKDEVVISQAYQNIVNASKHRAIYSGQYKLIYIPLHDRVKFELYNYIDDPDNLNDLSNTRTDILKKMKGLFYNFVNQRSSGNFIIHNDYIFPVFNDPVY